MKVQDWPLDRIIPYEKNPREGTERAAEKLAPILKRIGFRQPIVVDSAGIIIVGHTRRMAAEMAGLKSAPVHVASDLTPAQVKEYRIADNRTGEITTWEESMLAGEIETSSVAQITFGTCASILTKMELRQLEKKFRDHVDATGDSARFAKTCLLQMAARKSASGTVSGAALADLFGVNPRHIRKLVEERLPDGSPIVVRMAPGKYAATPSIQGYIKYLKSIAARTDPASSQLEAEKIRLTRAKANIAESEAERVMGGQIPFRHALKVLGAWAAEFKKHLRALPGRAAPIVHDLETVPEKREALERLVREILEDLATSTANVEDGKLALEPPDEVTTDIRTEEE